MKYNSKIADDHVPSKLPSQIIIGGNFTLINYKVFSPLKFNRSYFVYPWDKIVDLPLNDTISSDFSSFSPVRKKLYIFPYKCKLEIHGKPIFMASEIFQI